jgi:hypothetical protein
MFFYILGVNWLIRKRLMRTLRNYYRVIQGVCGEKCGENYYLVAKTLVARGRIELPTPCFSDKGKPCDLLLV